MGANMGGGEYLAPATTPLLVMTLNPFTPELVWGEIIFAFPLPLPRARLEYEDVDGAEVADDDVG